MKLFVWVNPYHVRYGSSMIVAAADSVEQAKTIAALAPAYVFGEYAHEIVDRPKLGEPTRIVDLPCAEWHEWKE